MSTVPGLEAALTAFEDPAAKARDLLRLHRTWAHTHEVPPGARGVVARSWLRQTPEGDKTSTPISDDALMARRERSRLLGSVVPVLKERLLPLAHEAGNELVISDDEGYPLWMFGPSPIRRRSDGLGFVEGARWREGDVGTNSLGTAMEERRPVQIFGPEHAREDQHAWVCTSAPILDRRARTPLGVVTLSGAFRTAHPHTLMLVTMAVREAVDTLAGQHERDLRRVARTSESYAGSGRFVVVDRHGWVARAEGYGVGERVWVPGSLRAGTVWVPEIGQVRAEEIAGGWVLHEAVRAPATVEVVRRPSPRVLVTTAGSSVEIALSERHAEIVALLAEHPGGLDTAALMGLLDGATTPVTIRAEMSRLRKRLGGLIESRPYRLTARATVRPDAG
ncbi:transcriptional regulator [Terrabacter tumescens]|uniref:Transcriptional regulator n=1 Tax=Terrabacter tumescens TaxID=60443 RepID=A0ABQ2HTA5_9MICO|nr:helix-turn-helix domain-containing protein [Terrabacter tumescens]GGM89214.1 transcriptional regulator [Terrabacter tumescens]